MSTFKLRSGDDGTARVEVKDDEERTTLHPAEREPLRDDEQAK